MKLWSISAGHHDTYGNVRNLLFEVRLSICVLLLSVVRAFGCRPWFVGLLDELFEESILRFHVSLWYLVDVGVVDDCTLTTVVLWLQCM
jgi:hypothetical protein